MSKDRRKRATTLLREVKADPDSADAAAFADMLDADDPTIRRYGLDGLSILGRRDRSVLTERVDRIATLLEDPDREVRAGASAIYAGSLTGDPVVEAVDALSARLEDSYPIVRWNALEGLLEAARSDPAACRSAVADVRPFLDAEMDHVREHAVEFLAIVSMEAPEAVVPATDRLLEILCSTPAVDVAVDTSLPRQADQARSRFSDVAEEERGRFRALRQAAGHAIYEVARADPGTVRPSVADIVDLLEDPDPQVRHAALDVLLALAEDDPATVGPYLDEVTARIEDAPMVRASASQVLLAVSPTARESVQAVVLDHAVAIGDLLDHESPAVRASAASLLALAADSDPSVIDDAREALETLRDDDAAFVRAAAADALADR